ncbi:hypothetical protein QCA50_019034 [Cerrena zonata]|uniref:Uncharacterized protein n=1 Tax=Cerrena zonata TaxID=2478898 RepID=A0AAW0FBE9_9APHY
MTSKNNSDPTISSRTNQRRFLISKRYQPNFSNSLYPLPSIEEFKLDHILANELKSESQELAGSLVRVSRKYQQDLRKEIRSKLTLEQKIQYKNISIAKHSNNLNKDLVSRYKKLNKVFTKLDLGSSGSEANDDSVPVTKSRNNEIDAEITQLLDLSIKSSQLIKSLASNLLKIDKKVNAHSHSDVVGHPFSAQNEKYPLLTKLVSSEERDPSSSSGEPVPSSPSNQKVSTPNRESRANYVNTFEIIEPSTPTRSPIKQTVEADITDPENFESFITDSISKYRVIQEAKYKNYNLDLDFGFNGNTHENLFKNPDLVIPEPSLSQALKENANSPLNLLYSSVLRTNHTQRNPSSPLSYPFSKSNPNNHFTQIKSIPTVELTPQVSHFKKLRINGSPITSATFAKGTPNGNIIYSPFGDGSKPSPEDSASSPLQLPVDGEQNLSPAKKALEESLALDHLRLNDGDCTFDSSALSSDSEGNDVSDDIILTSDSSDVYSTSEDENEEEQQTVAETNQYYSTLQKNLKLKKKRKQKKHKRTLKDSSPTPKYQPSHHTLKPKKSILKLPNNVSTLNDSIKAVKMKSPSPIRAVIDSQLSSPKEDIQKSSSSDPKEVSSNLVTQTVGNHGLGSNVLTDSSAQGTIISVNLPNEPEAKDDNDKWAIDSKLDKNRNNLEFKSINVLKEFLD